MAPTPQGMNPMSMSQSGSFEGSQSGMIKQQ
jgi:hypothetical protein